jgi:hypothetical protein
MKSSTILVARTLAVAVRSALPHGLPGLPPLPLAGK